MMFTVQRILSFEEFSKGYKITKVDTEKGEVYYLNLKDGKPGDHRFQATATNESGIKWELERVYDSYLITNKMFVNRQANAQIARSNQAFNKLYDSGAYPKAASDEEIYKELTLLGVYYDGDVLLIRKQEQAKKMWRTFEPATANPSRETKAAYKALEIDGPCIVDRSRYMALMDKMGDILWKHRITAFWAEHKKLAQRL